MDYRDIIKDNCEKHAYVSWWPKFAFHYTDATNAVSILNSGYLYSRINAEKMKLMQNDNASRQVIDMTKTEVTGNVRFYFRPLTPTQYYNEGFKHMKLRYDSDRNANVPVPIFFLFDLGKLLNMSKTQFSEFAQSGYGSPLYHSAEDFQKFDFNKIYGNGYIEDHDKIKYRHAEILYPDSFAIDSCIQVILCRNNIERTMLLNLLREVNNKAFYKYQSKIKICRENMFENNGLYVTDCSYHDGTASITFSDTYAKKNYVNSMIKKNEVPELEKVDARAEFDWVNARKLLYHKEAKLKLDYADSTAVLFRGLPKFKDAKAIRIKFYIEDKLMCYVEQPLSEIEFL